MVDNIKENYIRKSIEPISLKQTEKILEQMKSKSICRINNKGTGFFVKIPYKSKLLPVLITSNKVINIDDILKMKTISIYINNDKNIELLKLDRNRKIYTNEKLDITIIEIKENEDSLNNKFLELDNELINYLKLNRKERLNHLKHLNNLYSNESIYIKYSSFIFHLIKKFFDF